jgi:hypothetical protein
MKSLESSEIEGSDGIDSPLFKIIESIAASEQPLNGVRPKIYVLFIYQKAFQNTSLLLPIHPPFRCDPIISTLMGTCIKEFQHYILDS